MPAHLLDLNDHVALVTGGSRGIGRAISIALASAGAAVAVNYREREQEAAAVVAENWTCRRPRDGVARRCIGCE